MISGKDMDTVPPRTGKGELLKTAQGTDACGAGDS